MEEFEKMVDEGFINEAENILLESIDYSQKKEVLAAILFYQYISEKEDDFLKAHNYSKKVLMVMTHFLSLNIMVFSNQKMEIMSIVTYMFR